MAQLLRTEKTSWGGNKYIYACDKCGAEIYRYHHRPSQSKMCGKCASDRDRARAKERAIEHDKAIREQAINEYHDLIETYLMNVGILMPSVNDGIAEQMKGANNE